MILSGQSIRKRVLISPFNERTEHFGMTFGIGPAGYDIRMEFDRAALVGKVLFPSRSFLLVSAIEYLQMPPTLLAYVKDKSSWARRGLTVQNTVIEPGWAGHLTLELVNHTHHHIELLRGMPIAQLIFHEIDHAVEKPYNGKYQNQIRGPQEAR
jgi:dCTP deaminase